MTWTPPRELRAVTLWQPWASLIVRGAKRTETRSWAIAPGPILIHAARRPVRSGEIEQLHELARDALGPSPSTTLPRGSIVGAAWVTGCVDFESPDRIENVRAALGRGGTEAFVDLESSVGDFTEGRVGWRLAGARPCNPVPARGAQGLWRVRADFVRFHRLDDLVRTVRAQVESPTD